MKILKGGIIGAGFWANYQIAGWKELEGVEIVAVFNRTKAKAETIAQKFNIPKVYENAEEMMKSENLDFVDIITDVDTHAYFTEMAVKNGIASICQKPMAPRLYEAERMVDSASKAGVPFYVHENFRWQRPIREMWKMMQQGVIGRPFKGRISFCSAFPVFQNQPFLADLEEFILTDVGSHILDLARFLFGEVDYLTCHMASINPGIKGEDVANVFMKMKNGVSCFAEMSYSSILEKEAFPQTLILIEGELGSLRLDLDYSIVVTTRKGSETILAKPVFYSWADPQYALIHSSIVDCNRDILNALQGHALAETTGKDNLETVRLVHAAYASARTNAAIKVDEFGKGE